MPLEFLKYLADSWLLSLTAIVSGAALLIPLLLKRGSAGVSVTTGEATRLINTRNATIIDVRSSDEFASGHIVGSRNIPSEQLESRLGDVGRNRSNPVIVADADGRRSGAVSALLRRSGFAEAVSLQGGLAAWREAGLPLRGGGRNAA